MEAITLKQFLREPLNRTMRGEQDHRQWIKECKAEYLGRIQSLAEHIGVTDVTIRNYAREATSPSVYVMDEITNLVGKPMVWKSKGKTIVTTPQ